MIQNMIFGARHIFALSVQAELEAESISAVFIFIFTVSGALIIWLRMAYLVSMVRGYYAHFYLDNIRPVVTILDLKLARYWLPFYS